MAFINPADEAQALLSLQQEWPKAAFIHCTKTTAPFIEAMFSAKHTNKPLSLWVKGTNFQVQVWQALLKIPFGEVVSYSDIAASIAKPNAVRAVGTAIGKNPVAFYIPCHRVLQKSAGLGGYHWGLERKYALLVKEAALSHQ
jgi:AraC family transcriptional regulator of adaptative response/methylated-DNA-[protein]-cysteine methyltransferase